MTRKDITDAWAKIRQIDQTIPDEVLDMMKNAAIEKLEAAAQTPAQRTVEAMSSFVNNFGSDTDAFIGHMEREHRTLQQSFTKLILKWLEHIAKPEYRTDGRNIHSQQTAQKIMLGWSMLGAKDESQTYNMLPSQWLPMI